MRTVRCRPSACPYRVNSFNGVQVSADRQGRATVPGGRTNSGESLAFQSYQRYSNVTISVLENVSTITAKLNITALHYAVMS